MKRISNSIIISMFLITIFGFSILHIIIPDKSFSHSENRVLERFPEITFKNLMNGKFTKKFEEYVQDQFPYKDYLVGIKSDMERYRLKGENNGVYFGKNNRLIEKFEQPKEELLDNINAIKNFTEHMKHLNNYIMVVPNATKIYEKDLPKYAVPYDQLKIIELLKSNAKDAEVIDIYENLMDKKDEYIFFRTDHHWTMRGAYYAYLEVAKNMGFEAHKIDEFSTEIVNDDFYGTLYSKANNKQIPPDSIEIFKYKNTLNLEIYYDGSNEKHTSVFEWKHLDEKDKYSVFMDGNHALVDIKTNIKNGKKLVIMKDSFSHCLIPFLVNHYEEIHVLDLRYFKFDIYDYINGLNVNDVLFLYNTKSIAEDVNIKNISK